MGSRLLLCSVPGPRRVRWPMLRQSSRITCCTWELISHLRGQGLFQHRPHQRQLHRQRKHMWTFDWAMYGNQAPVLPRNWGDRLQRALRSERGVWHILGFLLWQLPAVAAENRYQGWGITVGKLPVHGQGVCHGVAIHSADNLSHIVTHTIYTCWINRRFRAPVWP